MKPDELVIYGQIDRTKIAGLLFDVDGTLSDTDDHMVDQVSNLLKPAAWLFRQRDPRQFSRWLVMAVETPGNFMYGLADTMGIDALFRKLYSWLSQKIRARRSEEKHFQIIHGVREMLDTLSKHYPIAIVSARDASSTERFLEYFNLLPYFKTIVTAQTCKYTKPYSDPVLYAAEQLGLAPEACLMIGDTVVDIRAGKSAGTQTVGVLCGFGTQRELKRIGADLILSNTPDIVEILLQ